MKSGRLHPGTEPASKEHLPPRRLNELPVLLALATIVMGVASVALLFTPRPPGEASPEAGFARDMMIHHAQAVRMAETVRTRTEDPEIRVLATDIVLTQQAEIGQMRGWLEAWGLPANGPEPPMAWMGHPTTGPMPGMATPEDLARLDQDSPEEADGEFLRLMIPHHESAVAMAKAALERSHNPEVQRLAQKTVLSQQAEVRGMQALLERKGGRRARGQCYSPYRSCSRTFRGGDQLRGLLLCRRRGFGHRRSCHPGLALTSGIPGRSGARTHADRALGSL